MWTISESTGFESACGIARNKIDACSRCHPMATPEHAHALSSTSPTGSAGTSYTLTWGTEDKLAAVHSPVGDTTYTYAADGTELLRKGPDSTTLYLPGQEFTRTNSSGVVVCTRYYSHNGTVVGERVGDTNTTYLFTDPHGTTTVAVPTTQSGTATPIRRQLDPYGNQVGATAGGVWPDQHGYLNKPTNPATGLTDVGARTYDASTGRFLSVDPVLDPGDPLQANGYAYADNNPVNLTDPTGLEPGSWCSTSDCPGASRCTSMCSAGDRGHDPGSGGNSNNTNVGDDSWNDSNGASPPPGGGSHGAIQLDPKKERVTVPNPYYHASRPGIPPSCSGVVVECRPSLNMSLYDLANNPMLLARCLSDMNSVCALDMTSMQMAGSIVSRLPTSGGFPFKPKRGQRLTNPGSISREDGDPVDKHGDKWQWDPIKIEWDVQHKDGSHTNIGPDGNITHGPNNTGRESQGGDANSFDTPLPRVSLTPQQLAQLSGGAMVAVLLGTLVVVAG